MVGAVMAATSDFIYGDLNHNMPSSVNLPATSSVLSDRARHYTVENHYEVDCMRGTSNVEAAQELADMLRGILDEQQADQLAANYDSSNNQLSYSYNSLLKATTNSQSSHLSNQLGTAVSSAHHSPFMLDAHALDTEFLQPPTSMDVESLLALSNPFDLDGAGGHAHRHESLSLVSAWIDSDYSKVTAQNSSSTDELSFNSSSSMQEYRGHQELESLIDLHPSSCTSPAHSIDDYSLSTINGGALSAPVVGCANALLLEQGVISNAAEVLNTCKAFDIDADITDNCHDGNNVADADSTTKVIHVDHFGSNIMEDHMVSHHVESTDGHTNKHVRDAVDINVSNQGCGMVCNVVYPSGQILMQKEAVYAAAAMQPVDWAGVLAGSSGARPKRRNVRISHDPQTVSARRRRERISDRIRVLQRMVPGGTKLDTASMLDEAIHYLKYLKSQVQALEWLERRSSQSNCLSLSASLSPACLYPNLNMKYIQPSPSSRLMAIK